MHNRNPALKFHDLLKHFGNIFQPGVVCPAGVAVESLDFIYELLAIYNHIVRGTNAQLNFVALDLDDLDGYIFSNENILT
jgi:hypothetical protein